MLAPKGISLHVPERNHLLTMAALSFLLGCLSASQLFPGGWIYAVLTAALACSLLLKRMGRKAGIAVAIFFWALGLLRAYIAADVEQPAPGLYEVTASVSGSASIRSENRMSFVLTDVALDGQPVSGNAYATLTSYDEPLPGLFDGARIRMQGYVYLPTGKSGAPHFDFRIWTLENGLHFGISGYSGLSVENTVQTAPIIDPWHRIREWMTRTMERVMGDEARVAIAMLLGERSGMSDEEREAFSELGIAHVMSVSGLHVSIIGSILCRLMDKLRLRRAAQWLILSVFLAAYCALTGFCAAAIRAAVMMLAYSFARLCLRHPDRLTVLMGSMLFVLLFNPLYAYSAGFVLSYCAMLGITLFSPAIGEMLCPPLQKRPKTKSGRLLRRLRKSVCGILTVSITAQLGVLLPTMAYFQQVPTYGLLINMLIVPLVSYVLLPLYAAVIPLSFIPWLGEAAGALAAGLTRLLLWLVSLLSCLPYASLRTVKPGLPVCLGLGLSILLFSRRLPGSFKRRALCSLLIAILTLGGAYLSRPADLRYIQLDVGQADSALILDGTKTILIDAGEDGGAALDYLMAECRDIDALVITHLHMDHIGGVEQLLNSPIEIRHVYLPRNACLQKADSQALALLERIRERGIPVTELARGDELRYNKTSLQVLWPASQHQRTGHDANEFSMAMLIDLDGYRILSAADLPSLYENYAAVPADIVKVAHHGSNDSTSAAFLRFVAPRFALISASGTRFLPHPETLMRLEENGTQVLRTDESGDIVLTVEDGVLRIAPYKAR